MAAFVNQFGRRPGRGVRPWLLIPKLLAVAVYFGGLAAAAALWWDGGWGRLDKADPSRLLLVERVSVIFVRVVVPGLVAAMLLGTVLLWHHGRVLLRMRWLRLKLVMVAIGVPTMHLIMSSRLGQLRQAAVDHQVNDSAASQFTWALIVLIAWSLALIVLGRLKPRLGQPTASWSTQPPKANPDQ